MEKPSLGTDLIEILNAFHYQSNQLVGINIVEAAIIGDSLRFRVQGNGKLGVVVDEICLRQATKAQVAELYDAIELGQVQIYAMPLYMSGRKMTKTVLHQATGTPLDPNSLAVRQQRDRLKNAYPVDVALAAAVKKAAET